MSASTTLPHSRKIGPQGNHDAVPSAGDTSLTSPSVATPPASPAVPPGYKRCKGKSCGAVLPRETGFYSDKSRPDGLAIYCRECVKRRAKEAKERQSAQAQAAARERKRIAVAAARERKRLRPPGLEVDVMLTVRSTSAPDGHAVTETFPAKVRTRLIYRGRPAFLAGEPDDSGETS